MSGGRPRHARIARIGSIAALALLAGVVLPQVPATSAQAVPAAGAAPVAPAAVALRTATPGVPEAPVVLYEEDFQNSPVAGATRVDAYTSNTGVEYTAASHFLNPANCNGLIFGPLATNTALSGFCTSSWWTAARAFPYVIGQYRGLADPNQNLSVAEQTRSGTNGAGTMLETLSDIPLKASGRYVTFSLDVAVICSGAVPIDQFFLLDGSNAIALNSTGYNACTDPTSSRYTRSGLTLAVNTFTGNQSVLMTGSTVGFRLSNQQPSGGGNDQAFDNFRILDVTPRLDKAFTPMNPVTGTSRLTLTVTNTADLASKLGWSASDQLAPGLVVADDPATETTCTNGGITAEPGSSTIAFSGDLAGDVAHRTSCTFSVDVEPSTPTAQGDAPQSFQNCAANLSDVVGLDSPASCATVTFPAVAQLSISKATSATADLAEGDAFTYTVTATNTGGADYTAAVPATVTDDLSGVLDDAEYADDATATRPGTISYSEPVLSWSGPLAVGDSVEITYTATATLAGDGSLANTACVPADQASADPCTTTTTVVPITPSIELVKSVSPSDPASFTVGTELMYTFVATNTGNLVLDAPAVTELSFDGAGAMSPIDCPTMPLLAPGDQLTCTAEYTVEQADIDDHDLDNPLVNEARASAIASNAAAVSDDASAQVPAIQSPALTIAKSAQPSNFTQAGETVAYEFLVTNTGNVTLSNATVVEGEFSGTGSLSGIDCPSSASSMPPGARVTCQATYELTQADVDAGSVRNTASATATPPAGGSTSADPDEAIVTIAATPALTLVKSADPGPYTHAGETVAYTFEVLNVGNVTIDEIAIEEQAFSGSGELGTPVCAPATIAPSETATCTLEYGLTQEDVDAGLVTNSATATGTPPGGGAIESALSSASVTITPAASLGLVKTIDRAVVAGAGAAVTYSFTVTNTGQSTIHDVAITEAAFTGTGTLSAPECATTTLAPAASTICTADYTTTTADLAAGRVDNTATASASSPFGDALTSDPSSAALRVDPVAAALATTGATLTWQLGLWGVGLVIAGGVAAVIALRRTALGRR